MDIQALFDQSPVGVIAFAGDGLLSVNPAAEALLHLGKGPSPDDVRSKLQRLLKVSVKDMLDVANHDGRDLLTFLVDESEEKADIPLSFYCFFNHSDVKKAGDVMIIVVRTRAAASARLIKQKLMAMAVHDIKTPISSIKESSSLLWDGTVGELNDMQKKCIDIIRKEIVRLHRIMENIVRIGQFEEHSFDEDVEPIDISGLFSQLQEISKDKCQRKKINFSVGLHFEKPCVALARRSHVKNLLYYILDYILENAHPSTPVAAEAVPEDGIIKVIFSYSGFIPAKELRQTMFSDFWEDKKTALIRKEHIDAFSLRICRSLAGNMGARIEIAEKDSGKVEFTVFLPVK
ncbi:MAG: PAS domain-containing sensor histidine kinase [Candidatus Aureabacteria bacterium]|nr:PAS domain-containing sensor histidine kinase [Candidatus Auribacterota bacterium]